VKCKEPEKQEPEQPLPASSPPSALGWKLCEELEFKEQNFRLKNFERSLQDELTNDYLPFVKQNKYFQSH